MRPRRQTLFVFACLPCFYLFFSAFSASLPETFFPHPRRVSYPGHPCLKGPEISVRGPGGRGPGGCQNRRRLNPDISPSPKTTAIGSAAGFLCLCKKLNAGMSLILLLDRSHATRDRAAPGWQFRRKHTVYGPGSSPVRRSWDSGAKDPF